MKKQFTIRSIISIALVIIFAFIIGKKIYFKAADSGINAEPYIKNVSDKDIVVSGETAYVDSQILVNMKAGTSKKQLTNWVKKYGGVIVGEIPVSFTYQVEFPAGMSQKELEDIIDFLEQQEQVDLAILHYATLKDVESIGYSDEEWTPTEGQTPNTPFEETDDTWDSVYPDGPNWWAEAIWLSGIGNMDIEFCPIKVGIVDTMFDTSHPDIESAFIKAYQNPEDVATKYSNASDSEDEEIKNEASTYAHGTHVAGIIGARVNNHGIAGVAPNAQIYGFSLHGIDEKKYTATIEVEYAIATLLRDGVQIINYSMGHNDLFNIVAQMASQKNPNELTADEQSVLEKVENERRFLEAFFRHCESQYDFLFFKAAGNANNKSIVRASEEDLIDDKIQTCAGYRYYNSERDSSLSPEMIITNKKVSCKDETYFDDEDVRASILYIGAMDRIDKHGKFKPAAFSCIDADILTPGVDILSDFPEDRVGYMSGTSMAAPIASGIAAMVWGANPKLKASEVRDILINAQRPFESVLEFAEVPLTNTSDYAMLNGFYAVNAAIGKRESESIPTSSESSNLNQEYAVIMGCLYEEAENSPQIDLENATDIMLTITDDKELYQKDANELEEGGGFVFFVKPGKYRLTVDSSYYDPCEIEVTAEEGKVNYQALGLTREEVKKRLLNEYKDSLNTYYGNSYQYVVSLQRTEQSVGANTTAEDFDAGRKIGSVIDDFDDDGEPELLVIATDDDFNIIYEMYAVNGNEVSLVAHDTTIADDRYGNVTLPMSSRRGSEDCALISCFVEEATHKIFLQVSYNISAFIDGHCTFITNTRYAGGNFYDMHGLCVVGSSCEDGYPRYNLELLRMGVPYPNIKEIFESLSPLYDCFDDGIYEIFHARQNTIDLEYDENDRLSSIRARTLFDSQEELYKKPLEKRNTETLSIEKQHELYTPVIEEYDKKMKSYGASENGVTRATYYCYIDVDGNGTEELLVDFELNRYGGYKLNSIQDESGDCFGMYTIIDRQPVAVYEPHFRSMNEKGPFVRVLPGDSLVTIVNGYYLESYVYEYYVFKNNTLSDMPIMTANYTYDANYYVIDEYRYSQEEFFGLFKETDAYYMRIFHEDEFVPFVGE